MQVAKWGNSLAVRLPKRLVNELRLKEGDDINIVATGEGTLGIVRDSTAADAVTRMANRAWIMPDNWHFDRDEANAR